MGVEYSLNDPAKGECFDFGKGWHGDPDRGDYDPAPSRGGAGHDPFCPHCGKGIGYRWRPLTSREQTLHYVRTHFYWLESTPHDEGCDADGPVRPGDACPGRYCDFNEPSEEDLTYAAWLADTLWAWLEERDQSQLDVNNDSGDDRHCDPGTCDEDCKKWIERGWGRHFITTGTCYREQSQDEKTT